MGFNSAFKGLRTYEHAPFHDPILNMSKYAVLVDRPVMVNDITYSAYPHLNNHVGQMKPIQL